MREVLCVLHLRLTTRRSGARGKPCLWPSAALSALRPPTQMSHQIEPRPIRALPAARGGRALLPEPVGLRLEASSVAVLNLASA